MMLLALNRLRDGFATEFDALLRELYGEPDEVEKAPPLRLCRGLCTHAGLSARAGALRLGLGASARREFAAVGIVVPKSKDALAGKEGDDAQTERLWLASVLYERAGDWHRSHFIPRHILTEWQKHYPRVRGGRTGCLAIRGATRNF